MGREKSRARGHWEHFAHEADMGVRGIAPTLAEAFAQTAVALTAVITDPDKIQLKDTVTLTAADPDPELLLVDFLNAIIYEMASRRLLFGRYNVTLEDSRLTATARGELVDVARHQPAVEVKGATYTALMVKQLEDHRWIAQCVVDV